MRRQPLRVVIEEREACEVVGHHAAQADRNRLQELAQLEVSNHGVVDLEQQALPIPFVGELSLIGHGRF